MATLAMQERIETRLREALGAERLRVVNESYQHNVPANSETHWNVIMVCPPLTITREEIDEGIGILD